MPFQTISNRTNFIGLAIPKPKCKFDDLMSTAISFSNSTNYLNDRDAAQKPT